MKKLSLILVFLSFLTSGCISNGMFREAMLQNGFVPNWVGLHKNPKVGDFSEYRGMDGSVFRLEVLSEKDGLYEVAQTTLESSSSVLKEFSFNLFVDRDGNVTKADMVELATGQRDPIKVATPGKSGYIHSSRSVPNRNLITDEF